jgi:hypothetical protein
VRVPQQRARWRLLVYPDAVEASGCFLASRPASRGFRVGGADPERSRREASRRARGQVRRYCASNRLNRLGTLTYRGEGCHDPGQLRADVGLFFRRLRDGLGGSPLPYLWVGEWHPGGHGLHVHFAVGRFVPRSHIDAAWGHGFISIKLLGDLPGGSRNLEESRRAARYLSKYVSKTLDGASPGLHRYEVAQGFQPARVAVEGPTAGAVLDLASASFGSRPETVWFSSDDPDWAAPPAVWAQWRG